MEIAVALLCAALILEFIANVAVVRMSSKALKHNTKVWSETIDDLSGSFAEITRGFTGIISKWLENELEAEAEGKRSVGCSKNGICEYQDWSGQKDRPNREERRMMKKGKGK